MLTGLEQPQGEFLTSDIGFEERSSLPIDHPGAHDPAYRARRDPTAGYARRYREDVSHEIPLVDYTADETEVWRYVCCRLEKAQAKRACSFYLQAKKDLGISCLVVPQLRDLSEKLQRITQFRLAPIEGLVETRAFLSWLGRRTMLCTQYVRHHSRPDYTPEPDVVHEFIGHVPAFTNPAFADFSEFIGKGAAIANEEQLIQLGRLYWFTVEFGLVQEGAGIKAFGAGLLSSYGELEYAFSKDVERRPFDLRTVINTPYEYSEMQPLLFVIPSYAQLKEVTREFIESFQAESKK